MTPIQLTDEQHRVLVSEQVQLPMEVFDPATHQCYVLLAREQYEKVRSLLEPSLASASEPHEQVCQIPAGILRSQRTFWRCLPHLLETKKNHGQWVCFNGDECIGIARTKAELIRTICERGLALDDYYAGIIRPHDLPPWEPIEMEPIHPHHYFDNELLAES